MPKKIELSEVMKRLPSFVKIIPESYRGMRYKADFIDTEYKEKFTAEVYALIKLQHGCARRSQDRKSKTNLNNKYIGKGNIYPLELLKAELPKHLEIDEKSYTGKRNKARFYDKEFNVWFEAYPGNILRTGKGYCKARKEMEFKKQIQLSLEEIQTRIYLLYGDELQLIPETYINTNNQAKFLHENTIKSFNVQNVLLGKALPSDREKFTEWKRKVFGRDNHACQVCGSNHRLRPHHLNSWNKYPKERFELENGLTLCEFHHEKFHLAYGKGDNTREQFIDWLKSEMGANERLLERLSEKQKSPPE